VIFGLQQGSAVLKEINKEMSLEAVEKLMDDTADAIAYQEVYIYSWLGLAFRKSQIYLLHELRMRRRMRCWKSWSGCIAKH